jgi:hypothetical protein
MSEHRLYREVQAELERTPACIYLSTASGERLAQLALGVIESEIVSPAKIASSRLIITACDSLGRP